ncbi:MAG TPA: glycosyltransferase [Thermoanaerobaculia bacterium]|nr:glycosyltransferase [Thermoanaerobaculia bacterium]
MRVAQVTLRNASEYEKKCRRVDRVALAAEHEIVESERDADVVHVYGAGVRRPRLWSRTAAITPLRFLATLAMTFVPEAVEEQYFAQSATAAAAVGVFVRPSVRNLLELTRIRLHRTRDDVDWHLLDRVPTPDDFAQVAVWLDPAAADDDFDGFVAEALAMGRIVVASRTPINVQRLEHGRTGFLVPPDANEMTHAILTALFKPEIGRPRSEAARQTVSKFKPRQRVRALTELYERLRS